MIQSLRVEYMPDTYYSNIVIGEAIDFDIPSDSGVRNYSGFDPTRNLIYQIGVEHNQDDSTECQDNDLRYGGLAHMEAREDNGCHVNDDYLYSAYTADNKPGSIQATALCRASCMAI